jgi:ABC-type branched-subunit amino acid transport system permease subunit
MVIVAFAVTLPWWGESSWMREFVQIACYFIFAMMWNLLAGYGGMVSIGQQAFFGFGGYVMLMLGNFAGSIRSLRFQLRRWLPVDRDSGLVRRLPVVGWLFRNRDLGHR